MKNRNRNKLGIVDIYVSLMLGLMMVLSSPAQAHGDVDHTQAAAFFTNLSDLCGARFEGKMTFPEDGQDSFAGKLLVAKIAECSEQQIRVPFHVGEDQSRTWVISQTEHGLQLKHDHRHSDGTPDEVTDYGGTTETSGSELIQAFPADAYTAKLIPAAATNVWNLSFSEDFKTLTYHLTRFGKPRFTAVLARVEAE